MKEEWGKKRKILDKLSCKYTLQLRLSYEIPLNMSALRSWSIGLIAHNITQDKQPADVP